MKQPRRKTKRDAPALSTFRFVLTYVVAMSGLFLLLAFKPLQKVIDLNGLYTEMVVFLTGYFVQLLGLPVAFQGSLLELPSISLDIKFGCNGLEAVMIYAVAVAAVPLSLWNRIAGIVLGFLVIQVVNIARLVALAYVGVHYGALLEFVHIYIAQGMMIAVALGMFLLYLSYGSSRIGGGTR